MLTQIPQTLLGRSAADQHKRRFYLRRESRSRNDGLSFQQNSPSALVLSTPHSAAQGAPFASVLFQVTENPLQRSPAPAFLRPSRQLPYLSRAGPIGTGFLRHRVGHREGRGIDVREAAYVRRGHSAVVFFLHRRAQLPNCSRNRTPHIGRIPDLGKDPPVDVPLFGVVHVYLAHDALTSHSNRKLS